MWVGVVGRCGRHGGTGWSGASVISRPVYGSPGRPPEVAAPSSAGGRGRRSARRPSRCWHEPVPVLATGRPSWRSSSATDRASGDGVGQLLGTPASSARFATWRRGRTSTWVGACGWMSRKAKDSPVTRTTSAGTSPAIIRRRGSRRRPWRHCRACQPQGRLARRRGMKSVGCGRATGTALPRRTTPSPPCTPRTGPASCGWPGCSCTTRAGRRTSSRTSSSPAGPARGAARARHRPGLPAPRGRHRCTSTHRRRGVEDRWLRSAAGGEDDLATRTVPSAEDLALVRSEGAGLIDALAALPRRQREVVVLRTGATCPRPRSPSCSASPPAPSSPTRTAVSRPARRPRRSPMSTRPDRTPLEPPTADELARPRDRRPPGPRRETDRLVPDERYDDTPRRRARRSTPGRSRLAVAGRVGRGRGPRRRRRVGRPPAARHDAGRRRPDLAGRHLARTVHAGDVDVRPPPPRRRCRPAPPPRRPRRRPRSRASDRCGDDRVSRRTSSSRWPGRRTGWCGSSCRRPRRRGSAPPTARPRRPGCR